MTASADSAPPDTASVASESGDRVPFPAPVVSAMATWLAVVGVVVGHLGLLVASPDGIGLVALVLVEGTLLVALVGVELGLAERPPAAVGALAVAWVGLVGATVAATTVWSGWPVALGAACCLALLSYALHRVELVTLGLVEDVDERE